MNTIEAMLERHSVRKYKDQPIEGDVLVKLQKIIDDCNHESGLNIQLYLNEPKAFSGAIARYGQFRNVFNYIALVGKKETGLDERCGYFGEKIVLEAQKLGLNTCWVALSFSKSKSAAIVEHGEKFVIAIAIGYGENSGTPRKKKPIEKLYKVNGRMPDWFRRGVEAAQLAPTAMNQQKFCFELMGNTVNATPGFGPYTKVDLGIAKYHFEVGADNKISLIS